MNMITKLQSFQNGIHGQFFLEVVAELARLQAIEKNLASHGPQPNIDRKFKILAVNPVNGKVYDETNSFLLCAKDAAAPAALIAYRDECAKLGAQTEHITSAELLLERVLGFQKAAGGGRIPDTVGAEIARCLHGEGL